MDKVSVIVPAYNVESYIETCVRSLENQTYRNLEIIIVEDCSTDQTLEVCRRLAQIYPNIMLLNHEKNRGLEGTREDGIAAATGKWIMFLDADDEYMPDGVEKVMALVDENPPDIVLCPYAKVVNGLSTPCEFNLEGTFAPGEICQRIFTEIPLDVISCIGSKVYSREFIGRNGIHFDRQFRFNEDGGYIYTCLLKAKRIVAANIPFYQYNIRTSGSIQSSYRKDMFSSISNADRYLRKVLEHYGCFEGKAKAGYLTRRASTMIASLVNEAGYGGYASFRSVFNAIRRDEDFGEVGTTAMREGSRAHRAMVLCARYHLSALLYLALRMKLRHTGGR